MAEPTGGEKTLPASPQKRQRVREEGNVPKSQDLNAALMLLAALITVSILGQSVFTIMLEAMGYFFHEFHRIEVTPRAVQSLAAETLSILGRATIPLMLVFAAAGIVSNIMQVGVLFAPKAIQPKFSKLNPFTGFKKFVSLRSFVELIKSILKLTIIAWLVYLTMRTRWEDLLVLGFYEPWSIVQTMAGIVFTIWWRVVAAMLALGLLDYGFQRWQFERDQMMTVQEAREELKQLEGDPRIRQRVRQIQRQMAMQRMMREVPTADVVITNPTTYAVALRYDMAAMDAPRVVAKGARLVAGRIRELASENQVPIVEKPELARTLFRTVEVGQSVPENLFRAVAEILAYVYRIDRRAEKLRERERAWTRADQPAA